MRPRRFRRGIKRCQRPKKSMRASFNEAPAISPGNRRGNNGGKTMPATASMRPRRFRRGIIFTGDKLTVADGASMRPRRFRRGICRKLEAEAYTGQPLQ